MNYDEMTADELECSDYGREHGPHVTAFWVMFLMFCTTCDWLILRAIIHAVKAIL